MLLLWACTGPKVQLETGETADTASETAETADSGETSETAETAETEDTGPVDQDADGFPASADCDDTNAAVYPGAPETWNSLDDDCDGFVDGQGVFQGSGRLTGEAVYKGERMRVDGTCTTYLERVDNLLTFAWSCLSKKSGDPESFELLLGERLSVEGEDGIGDLETTWEGNVEFVSSDGWDSRGEAWLNWTSTREIEMSIRLDAAILDVAGTSVLAQGKDPC